MKSLIEGKAYKFGDNVDTDVIAPAMTISFGHADKAELDDVMYHAFESIRPDFYKEVKPHSILIAGRNFGFGSHREQATTVIEHMGFDILIADSVARLYQRNSFAIGFPVLEVPGITKMVDEGDVVSVDLINWTLTNKTTGKTIKIEPLSETALKIISYGGIIEYMKARLEKQNG